LTFPQISETSSGNGERFPMSGTIEEVGSDIKKLKEVAASPGLFDVIVTLGKDKTLERLSKVPSLLQ